jgi:hypothetical protein
MRCRDGVKAVTMSAAVLVAGGAGCVVPSPLIRRASKEFHCDAARINVVERRDISYGVYDIEACGDRARYSCVGGGGRYEVYRCVREPDPPRWDPDPALAANLPSGALPSDPSWPGGHRRRICAAEWDDACDFWQDGAWRWRPSKKEPCGGGYLTCD